MTWSLAAQFQFYLALPLLFKLFGNTRRLLFVFLLAIVVSTACRVYAFYHLTSFGQDPAFLCNNLCLLDCVDGCCADERFILSFFYYTGTVTRMGVIFIVRFSFIADARVCVCS